MNNTNNNEGKIRLTIQIDTLIGDSYCHSHYYTPSEFYYLLTNIEGVVSLTRNGKDNFTMVMIEDDYKEFLKNIKNI